MLSDSPQPAARTAPERRFTWRLALGAGLLLAAAWAFGAIAEDVVNRDAPLGTLDLTVAQWLHAHAAAPVTVLMIFVSDLGAPLTVAVICAVLALVLLWRREREHLLLLLLAVPGGGLLNLMVKQLVHRARPTFDVPILTLASYSFPSGHAMGSTVFYGTLAAIAAHHLHDARPRALLAVLAAALVLLVCFSRMYLGVHYLSDVVAGCLEGVVWLGACIAAVDALRWRGARAGGHSR
jgi:undecaprenyl-diphosphatase